MSGITRENIDRLLDSGMIQTSGFSLGPRKWYTIRRNGATKRWKRDPSRIYVPFKVGFKGYGAITERDFAGLELDEHFRIDPTFNVTL